MQHYGETREAWQADVDSLTHWSTNAGTHKITNIVDPTDNQDAATKKYVDNNKVELTNMASSNYEDDDMFITGITTSEQNLMRGGMSTMQESVYLTSGKDLEIEVITYVKFANMDAGGDVVIELKLNNDDSADYGSSKVIIRSEDAQSKDYIQIHLKGYWEGLSSGNKYVQFTVKQNGSADADAIVTINALSYPYNVIAKEY